MRKFTLWGLFMLFGITAMAADFVPDANKKYFLRNLYTQKFVLHNASCTVGSNTILSTWLNYDLRSLFLISGDATNGYTIRVNQNPSLYVYAVNTNDADSNVGIKEVSGDVTEDCLWQIVEKDNANGKGWNIIPKNGTNGWNCRGLDDSQANGCVGQWQANDSKDNIWQILTPSELATTTFESSYTGIGSIDVTSAKDAAVAAGDVLGSNPTDEVLATFKTALSTTSISPANINLPTGYYRMKNCNDAGTQKTFGAYVFTDLSKTYGTVKTLACVPESTVLESNQNNYIWHIVRSDELSATLHMCSGQGLGINFGSADVQELHLGVSDYWKDGFVYFTEGVHFSNQSHLTVNGNKTNATEEETRSNPFVITNWAYSSAKGSAYTFEPVDVSGLNVYNVVVEGTDATVTLTTTSEVARDGGFFLTSSTIAKDDIKTPDFEGWEKTVTINEATKTITAHYENTADLSTERHYQTIVGTNGNYNTASSTSIWRNAWTSNTGYPQVKVSVANSKNNMSNQSTGENFIIASGSDRTSTYNVELTSDDCRIKGFSFSYSGAQSVTFTLEGGMQVTGTTNNVIYLASDATATSLSFTLADPENNQISLTNFKVYYETTKTAEELTPLAGSYLAQTGVGKPRKEGATRTTLQDALAKVASNNTACNRTNLYEAISAYIADTDVQMPEDGKAYTLTFRPTDTENGTYRYINFTGTTLETVKTTLGTALPASATFVCHKWEAEDGTAKYLLVPGYGTTYGKFLTYQTVTDTYTADINDFTVEALVDASDKNNITDKSTENLFGYVFLTFQRRKSGTGSNANKGVYIMKEATGAFDNTDAPYLNGSYTSALIMEEVSNYPNTPTLNAAEGIEEVDGIATFSAPYAATIPAGVTAYYAQSATDDYAAMTEISGGVIPAGTGVILTGTSGTQLLLAPAASSPAALTSNLLGNSAGEAETLSASTDYILANVDNVVAFYQLNTDGDETARTLGMNKAYLDLSSVATGASYSVKMKFGGNVSGIQEVEKADDANAPIYDLSGRRVTQAAKGGVYIQNGKKFIVK